MKEIVGYIRPPGDVKHTRSIYDPTSIPEDEEWQYRLNDRWTNLETKHEFLCLGFVPWGEERKDRLVWTRVNDNGDGDDDKDKDKDKDKASKSETAAS